MKFMSCEEACRIVAGLAKDDVVVITMLSLDSRKFVRSICERSMS